jgi:hypothetical protein
MAITTLDEVKAFLGINDTSYDVQIEALIPLVEESYLMIRNAPFEKDVNGDNVYPIGSNITSSEMIGYKLSTTANQSFTSTSYGKVVSSESLDSHSISYESGSGKFLGGYPKSIVSAIKVYINGM